MDSIVEEKKNLSNDPYNKNIIPQLFNKRVLPTLEEQIKKVLTVCH
jgi:hypothetical protein